MPKLRMGAVLISLVALFPAWPADAPAAERTGILYIPAITCGSTAAQAETVLRRMKGVTGAVADVVEAAATVTWDDDTVALEEIMAVLGRNGFPVVGVVSASGEHGTSDTTPAPTPAP